VNVATHVGEVLARLGVDHVFGVVGSGNFHVTNALVAGGARFVPAAHEGGAATMADAYARSSGRVGVLSVHQGPGVTNALTGIAEAAKSRTPLIVLAPEATSRRSNFYIDLQSTALAVGAEFHRVRAASATEDVMTAWRLATFGLGGTVVLGLPLDEQVLEANVTPIEAVEVSVAADPEPDVLAALTDSLRTASRPVFIAGRGAAHVPYAATRDTLLRLADRCGALVATSAAAKGLFAGDPWNLDVSGGFASPLAAGLIADADLIVGWGCTLNMWTTRHGTLIAPDATVIRVDHDLAALDEPLIAPAAGDIRVRGDVRRVADLALDALVSHTATSWRTAELAARLASSVRWRDVPFVDESTDNVLDARALTIALDDALPVDRVVAVDSGNFMGYPAMFLSVPDASGFCMTQAYQSVGLGLASAIGAALAQPERLTVAALGDGGFLMSVAEMTTVERLGLPMVILVYNDAAYGAEVHHFGPDGFPLGTVKFPEAHIAAIAEGFGCTGITVRTRADLSGVREWLDGPRDRPLVIDAKVGSARGSWWLEEAFRGH
jgi:thiamine pyrophosphate-dependent acetolactate synthase large subunit-like protein